MLTGRAGDFLLNLPPDTKLEVEKPRHDPKLERRYLRIEPKDSIEKPIGEWNTVVIVCKGRNVTVTQNGEELVKANLDDYKAKEKNHPGLAREKGHIGFQSYNIRVDFRNVVIKELK